MRDKVYCSNRVEEVDGSLVISFCAKNLCDGQRFNFVLCQCVPCSASALPVVFEIEGQQYPLLTKLAEKAVGNDVRPRTLYHGYFSMKEEHFIACDAPRNLCDCGR